VSLIEGVPRPLFRPTSTLTLLDSVSRARSIQPRDCAAKSSFARRLRSRPRVAEISADLILSRRVSRRRPHGWLDPLTVARSAGRGLLLEVAPARRSADGHPRLLCRCSPSRAQESEGVKHHLFDADSPSSSALCANDGGQEAGHGRHRPAPWQCRHPWSNTRRIPSRRQARRQVLPGALSPSIMHRATVMVHGHRG